MELLTRDQPNLQIILIEGMGGIGKTTLARLAFQNKYVVEHFDIRVWFTISQEYSVHEILQGILRDFGITDDLKSKTLVELRQRLYQELCGRRYLIVMDDLWSTNDWDDFKLSFPNDVNGSRVMVTTRLSDVAISVGSHNPYLMDFLNEDKSWDLLCEKAFIQGSLSPELEEIGKRIAKSCRGLPLAIVVIGGLLAKSNMTREYWESVAQNVNSYANSEDDEQCLNILSLSYHHLPIHLKACFLYMRVFPEDHEVRVSKLIKLWIAEEFVKPLKDKNLEEVAEEYLQDLIDRNLFLIRKLGSIGEIKTCGVHDLLRDLCIRESHTKHFFHVPKVQHIELETKGVSMCFLCSDKFIQEKIHLLEVILGSGSTSSVSPWVCAACKIKCPQLMRSRFVNLMLRFRDNQFEEFPLPTKLRCLTVNSMRELNFVTFSSISLLWNLQTLIVDGYSKQPIVLPSEIWEMSQLRHIKIQMAVLRNPVGNHIERKDRTILENLHTLSSIRGLSFTEEVFKRIPNIKKLHISCSTDSLLTNLAHLNKLESLVLNGYIFSSENIAFPHSLKKLKLYDSEMPWKDMSIIGSLPNLEALELSISSFIGPEWNPVEGEFLRLKFLSISHLHLVRWRAEDTHFPCLKTLVLQWLQYLEEIPSGIGDIATLRSITLIGCSDFVIR